MEALRLSLPKSIRAQCSDLEDVKTHYPKKQYWTRPAGICAPEDTLMISLDFSQFFDPTSKTGELKCSPVAESHKDKKCQNTHILDTESLSSSAFEESQMSILTQIRVYMTKYTQGQIGSYLLRVSPDKNISVR